MSGPESWVATRRVARQAKPLCREAHAWRRSGGRGTDANKASEAGWEPKSRVICKGRTDVTTNLKKMHHTTGCRGRRSLVRTLVVTLPLPPVVFASESVALCGVTWDAVPEQSWYQSCGETLPYTGHAARADTVPRPRKERAVPTAGQPLMAGPDFGTGKNVVRRAAAACRERRIMIRDCKSVQDRPGAGQG